MTTNEIKPKATEGLFTFKWHDLKITPYYFNEILFKEKRFEVRYNDRDFKAGDSIRLIEYMRNEKTGRIAFFLIVEVYKNYPYLADGYVILSLKPFPYALAV